MGDSGKKRVFFWIGLTAMSLLYSFYYVSFLYGASMEMPLRARHVIKFLFIIAAYAAGGYCLKRYGEGWTLKVWHVFYGVLLPTLVLLGFYDWWVVRTPLAVRGIADSLQDFLVSPVLYVVMGIIGRRANGRV